MNGQQLSPEDREKILQDSKAHKGCQYSMQSNKIIKYSNGKKSVEDKIKVLRLCPNKPPFALIERDEKQTSSADAGGGPSSLRGPGSDPFFPLPEFGLFSNLLKGALQLPTDDLDKVAQAQAQAEKLPEWKPRKAPTPEEE